jgi:hypothetical protein
MGRACARYLGVAFVTLAMAWSAPPAVAATYTVNTTGDPVGTGCTGGTCSLRQAITATNGGAGGDTIVLPAARIVLSLGILSVDKPVTIAGAGTRVSIVDANSTSGIINFSAAASPSAVQDVTFTGGRSSSAPGVVNDATLRLTAVAVTGIVATNFAAGGIYNGNTGSLTLERSLVSGNSVATVGAGIYNLNALTVVNSTISGNTANTSGSTWEGGGIYTDGTATIVNSTVTGNSANRGGGISVGSFSTATLQNTIVAENVATGVGQPGNCRFSGTLTSQGGNLEDTNTCNLVQATDLRNTAPALGPLQDNAGPTDTRALVLGSLAIDRGGATGCPPTDQRGVARPQQGGCDIGAYEFAPPSVTTGAAGNVKTASAVLAGSLVPNLRATVYHFEYGRTAAYGSSTLVQSAGAGNSAVAATAALAGLRAGTTYHFRLVGTNADGTSAGADRTFRTAGFGGVGLRSKKLSLDRRGRVTFAVSCPAGTAGGICDVRAALFSPAGKLQAATSKAKRRRAKLLGKRKFTVAAGRTLKTRLRLTRTGRKLALRGGKFRLRLVTRDRAVNRHSAVWRVVLLRKQR